VTIEKHAPKATESELYTSNRIYDARETFDRDTGPDRHMDRADPPILAHNTIHNIIIILYRGSFADTRTRYGFAQYVMIHACVPGAVMSHIVAIIYLITL